jgi:hypothetical protein
VYPDQSITNNVGGRPFWAREPQSSADNGFSTKFVEGLLTLAMQRSCRDTDTQPFPSQAILLDEINLASPQLLERLERFMLRMVRSSRAKEGRYLLPNKKDISHRAIVIVATMNSGALSNARSSLSTKLQGASHSLKIVPFTRMELVVLAGSILTEPAQSQADPTILAKFWKAHEIAEKLLTRETGRSSEQDTVTLREFLRVQQFRDACEGFRTDILIELVSGTAIASELLNELGIRSRYG